MTFRYSFMWAWLNFAIALVAAVLVYDGLRPKWWGWLLFSPLFIFMAYESARKVMYSLTIEGDLVTVRGFKPAQYSVSGITAVNVWNAKGGRIAVVACADGRRFNFPSSLDGFEELVRQLRIGANLPEPD